MDPPTVGRAVVLRLPRPVLYEAWLRLGWPRLPPLGGAQLVHAPSVAVPPRSGVPLAVTVHDAAPERFPGAFPARGRRFHRQGLHAAARRADLVLTVSAAAAEEITTFSTIPPDRIRVVHNGIDPPALSAARRRSILEGWGLADRPYVLWVGSLEPRKGVDTLVAAMARLRSRRAAGPAEQPLLVLAGYPGWSSDDLLAPPDRAALGSELRQLGPVGEAELWSLYGGASVFAFPSRHEGFGLPVLEAMSQGTAVVASDIPPIREIAGGVARLVAAGDVDAWPARSRTCSTTKASAIGPGRPDGSTPWASASTGPSEPPAPSTANCWGARGLLSGWRGRGVPRARVGASVKDRAGARHGKPGIRRRLVDSPPRIARRRGRRPRHRGGHHQRGRLTEAVTAAGPDAICHLAAQASVGASWEDASGTFAVNAVGTLNLIDAALACRSRPRVLLVSSSEVYGHVTPDALPLREDHPFMPVSPYAASKAAAELIGLQAWLGQGLEVIRARPFNHTGPGQRPDFVVPSLARQVAAAAASGATTLQTGNLDVRRDLTDVRDVVRAYRELLEHGAPGQVYNVCRGEAVQIRDVARRLMAIAGVDLRIVVDPARVRARGPSRASRRSLSAPGGDRLGSGDRPRCHPGGGARLLAAPGRPGGQPLDQGRSPPPEIRLRPLGDRVRERLPVADPGPRASCAGPGRLV